MIPKNISENMPVIKMLSEKSKENSFKNGARSRILDILEDQALIWNKEDCNILSQSINEGNDNTKQVQTLLLSRPPVWDVEKLIVNNHGTGVMLMGKKGIAIVELPKRWGSPPMFEGGSETIRCRVEYLGERFFTCNSKIEIVQAKWHPGSYDSSHVAVLASDNYLRIYNISVREIPEQAISVASLFHNSNSTLTNSKFGGGALLGETAVDFDFGPPIENELSKTNKSQFKKMMSNVIDDGMEERKAFMELKWPLFILYENGEVYYTITTLSRNRALKCKVYGPLSMTPSCDDNYGTDYCALMVLYSSPTVLVIGNAAGRFHHCIVLEQQSNSQNEICNSLNDLSFIDSNGESISKVSTPTDIVSLHVYESVQLEMSIYDTELKEKDISSSIVLHKDPTSHSRYWISHDEGVHGVAVPIVDRLNEFSDAPEDTKLDYNEWNDCECVVQHILCTRQLATSDLLPVVGLATISMPCLQSKMMILLSSMVIKILPINNIYNPTVPNYQMNFSSDSAKKTYCESFEDHIRSRLKRSVSQPFMLSNPSEETVTPQQYLSILGRTTTLLRKNYIQPQQSCWEDIQKRTTMLMEQKSKLFTDIKYIDNEKKQLTDKAHELAEKYEEANYKHGLLMKRLELVMNQIIRSDPLLSLAERTMLKELESMKDSTPELKNQLSQVKTKLNWQLAQMEKHRNNESIKSQQSSGYSEQFLKCMKANITKESDALNKLVQRVNSMKKDVNL